MFEAGCVEEEGGGVEQAGFEGGRNGEDEEDGDGRGCGEGFCGGGCGAMGEVERGGEGDEFGVVGNVL